MANHRDMLSTCSCHFGRFFGFFGESHLAALPDREPDQAWR